MARSKKGQKVRFMVTGAVRDADRVGIFTPKKIETGELGPGEMGFITAGIKQISDTKVGDTMTDDKNPATELLPGFKPSVPVVFCGLFPVDAAEFEHLRESLGKLALNDASFKFEPESSVGTGFWFPLRLSWACCISKLFRNGWNANSTSISLPRRRRSFTKSI